MSTRNEERNQLIREVLQYDPDIKVATKCNRAFFDLGSHQVEITPTLTATAVKKLIDRRQDTPLTDYCGICMETDARVRKMGCFECAHFYCEICFIRVNRHSKGIINCPYCRANATPESMSEHEHMKYIYQMTEIYKEILKSDNIG